MKKCRYCGRQLTPAREKTGVTFCPACEVKREPAHRFVVECAKFKRRINYEEILRKRAEEAEENDQRTTAGI